MNKRSLANPSFQAHPWHGVSPGSKLPERLTAFVEIVPSDSVKYEVDKDTGILRIDRPQRYSNQCPCLYGFIPQTYCGDGVAALANKRSKETLARGDGDPLDICILSSHQIPRGGILVEVRPLGGLLMIDNSEADDKIIAVLHQDALFADCEDIADVPAPYLDKLQHYFLTYKNMPEDTTRTVQIAQVYDRQAAFETIAAACTDYRTSFGGQG